MAFPREQPRAAMAGKEMPRCAFFRALRGLIAPQAGKGALTELWLLCRSGPQKRQE
jgi:hypothetical protein